jgi:transposase, IS5 family
MLRTVNAQPTLWVAILPEMCLGMPAELEAVGCLLDDAAFFEPFRADFPVALGRPSVSIETYLGLMFLKNRYRLGF